MTEKDKVRWVLYWIYQTGGDVGIPLTFTETIKDYWKNLKGFLRFYQ
jgi:hypothetical protein